MLHGGHWEAAPHNGCWPRAGGGACTRPREVKEMLYLLSDSHQAHIT